MKVIDTMSKALAAKIPGEEEHCNNVAEYSRSIAQRMNLDKKSCDDAYKAGLLHEIGMIGIPDALINRVDLTDDEYEIFKTYVSKGYQIINMLQTDESQGIAQAVRYHRENYDGSGFNEGISGDDIPLLARIVAIADYADRHIGRNEEHLGDTWVENPESIIIDQENVENLEQEITTTLSPMENQVLEYYLAGNGYGEIAELMGKTPKSIDNALRRIRTKIKEQLEQLRK